MGVPVHLTCLLRNLYAGQEATVRNKHGTMDWFQIGKGVHQGCILSPCLFNLYKEFSSVHISHSVISDSLRPHGLQHARPPWPSPTPRVYSNSCPLSQWCHPTTSSSVVHFSRLQSFPASGCYESALRTGGQSIGVSALASVLPVNIQDWFTLGWTSWISLQSKGLLLSISCIVVCMFQSQCPSLSPTLPENVTLAHFSSHVSCIPTV